MPDKIKTSALYKQLINAYGDNGSVSPGAFTLDEKKFTDKINSDYKYAEKIYGAMVNAYGDDGFKFTKDQFISGLSNNTSSTSSGNPNPVVDNIFKKYPGLNKFSSPNDYIVQDAPPEMQSIFDKNGYQLEYQKKGEDKYIVNGDTIPLNNVDKNRTYLGKNLKNPEKAIELDIISHGLHQSPEYNKFTADLNNKLISRYGKKQVEDNGGVDAYIRGYLSDMDEYKPYKKELSFLPKSYFNPLNNILSGNDIHNGPVAPSNSGIPAFNPIKPIGVPQEQPTAKSSSLQDVINSGIPTPKQQTAKKTPITNYENLQESPILPPESTEEEKKSQELVSRFATGMPIPENPINMRPPTKEEMKGKIDKSLNNPWTQYVNARRKAADDAQLAADQMQKNQAAADEFYKTPQGKLYYQFVRPLMKSLTESGGAMVATGTRLAGFDKTADKIVDYLSYDNAARSDRSDAWMFDTPTKLKGDLSVHNILPRTVEALTNIAVLLGTSEAMGGGNTGLMASNFMQTHENYRKAAKAAGLSDGEADSYALTAAATSSAMMPLFPLKGAATGELESALTKTGPGSVFNAIKDGVSVTSAVKQGIGNFAKHLGETEAFVVGQHVADAAVRSAYDDFVLGQPKFNQGIDPKELGESMVVMALAGSAMSVPGLVRAAKPSSIERSAWSTAARDPEAFSATVDKNIQEGNLKPEQGNILKQNVAEYSDIYSAIKNNGFDDNAASRMALDALKAKRLDEQNKPVSGISVLAPVRQQHEAAKATIQSDIQDAALGIPETGTQVSSEDVANKMRETGGANKIDQLSSNDYRVNDVDLNKLYRENPAFKEYIDNKSLRPEEDKEGLRNPPVLNSEGKIIDGMNRLAQQYADGERTTRAYVETKDNEINVQRPEEISKPNIVEKEPIINEENQNQNAVQVESPGAMDVREQPTNGEGVGQRNAEPEVIARKSNKEETVPEVKIEKEKVAYNRGVKGPEEEKSGTKESRDAAVSRLKDAWNSYKKMGIMEDPAQKMKRDTEMYKSLVNYVKEELLYRINTIKDYATKDKSKQRKEIIKQMVKEGVDVKDSDILTKAFNEAHDQISKIPGTLPEKEKTISSQKYIKDKILARLKGYEKGAKEATRETKKTTIENAVLQVRNARKAIFETLKEAKGNITRAQAKAITASLDRVIKNSSSKPEIVKRAIDRAIDIASRIANEVNNRKLIGDTRKLLKKVKALRRDKGMVKQDIDWIGANKFPDPSRVEDLTTYNEMLNDFLKSRTGNKKGFDYTKEEIASFLDKENENIYNENESRLQDQLDKLKDKGQIDESTTLQEYKDLLDNKPDDKTKNSFKESKDDTLRWELEDDQSVLKDRLDEFEGHDRDLAERLSNVDVTRLNSLDLRVMNNIMNNIAEYGTFDRAGDIIVADEANKIVTKMAARGDKVRILPSQAVMDKNTLSNTLSSLYHNNNIVARFRSETLGPVEIATNKYVKPAAAKNANELSEIFRRHDMTGLSNKKLDAYAFLNQWRSIEDAEIAAELRSGLDKRIDDIKYNFDKYTEKLGPTEGKIFREEAQQNAEALKELGLIEDFEIGPLGKLDFTVKDDLFKEDDPTAPLREAYGKLTTGEKAAYKHATDKIASTKDAVEDYARDFRGANFNEWPGGIYFPRTAIRKLQVEELSAPELQLNNEITDRFSSLNKRPGSQLKARAQKFSNDVFYDTDFFTNAVRGYYDALYTSHAMPEIQKLDKIINHPEFKKMLTDVYRDKAGKSRYRTQGEENYGKFKRQLVEALNQEKASPYQPRQGVNWLDEIVSRSVKGLLGNVYQAPRQYIPALINNMALNNPLAVTDAVGGRFKALVDKEYRDARNELLGNFTGIQRSVKGNAAYDKGFRKVDEKRSWYQNPLDWHSKLQDLASIPLEKSDIAAQHDLYMASYITSLLKQGKIDKISDFDIYKEAKNPDKEALAYAEQIAAEVNNESAKGYRPNVIKERTRMSKFLWMLQSFNLNAYRFAKQKADIAFGMTPGATTADRVQAWRHLIGYVGQVATYNVISKFTRATQLAIGYALIKALFGIDKEKDNEQLKQDESTKEWIRIGVNGASDLFLGGQNTIIRSLFQTMFNEGYNVWQKRTLAQKQNEAAANDEGETVRSRGTYLDPQFKPFFSGDNVPGEAEFYHNLYKTFVSGFEPTKKREVEDEEGMLPEDKRLQQLSKYVATPVLILGLSDFILFNRGMQNALRRNKKNKKANAADDSNDY